MQIRNITSISAYLPSPETNARGVSPASASGTDQIQLGLSPETFTSLVNDAKSFPDVRGELVDSYKARIQAGHYPSHDVIAGLTHVMSGLVLDGTI